MDKEIQKSQREADKREYSNRDRRNKFTGRLKKKVLKNKPEEQGGITTASPEWQKRSQLTG